MSLRYYRFKLVLDDFCLIKLALENLTLSSILVGILSTVRNRYPMEVYLFTVLLAHMHSTLNPFVYLITNAHFRQG